LNQYSLFISDLHLDPDRTNIVDLFCQFCQSHCQQADALYILGDLFEVWVGDDNESAFNQVIIKQLEQLSYHNTDVYIMHGNRDFLLGSEFAKQAKCTYLEDPSLKNLYGKSYLMMHGDTLCTQDTEYQKFRELVRSNEWQADFLSKPLTERKKIAADLRQKSKLETLNKSEMIMDVDQTTVHTVMNQQPCDYLIHGHTHRKAKHQVKLTAATKQRFVLGDWYESGSCIKVSVQGPEFALFE